ncbi:NAD(P)-dependent oxidoreductase [Pantoea rodasii]|uniref:NAD(P)-dependent oxidoreductase n=1 Tax=Pantoea rodasii TaxID=1076549 RepID=UPI0023E86D02|nr:NAD(P)-dependent oxidoreductase [Pantoea rodasii]
MHETSLADALKSGRLNWAGLDSFSAEPLTTPNRWQGFSNVILSSHIGGVSDASHIRMGTVTAPNILAALQQPALEDGVSFQSK